MTERAALNPEATKSPDWTQRVQTIPLIQHFPELSAVKEFRHKKVILSEDGNHLFNVVSKRYQLIRHDDAIQKISTAIETISGKKPEVNVISLNNGARILADFQSPIFGKIQVPNPKVKDIIKISLRLKNSYDSAWSFSAGLYAHRLVCKNGAVIPEFFGGVRGKHFANLGGEDKIAANIEALCKNIPRIQDTYTEWQGQMISFEEAQDMLSWVPKKYAKEILDETSFPKSKWDLYNQATYLTTHNVDSTNRQLEFHQYISEKFFQKAA